MRWGYFHFFIYLFAGFLESSGFIVTIPIERHVGFGFISVNWISLLF